MVELLSDKPRLPFAFIGLFVPGGRTVDRHRVGLMRNSSKAIWNPTPNQLAQCSHFFIGTTLAFAGRVFFGSFWLGCLATIGWCLPKEFVFDVYVEGDSRLDGVEDFMWYLIGAAFAATLVLLFC